MTFVRVSGFKIFSDRHGKVRCYHRTTGYKIDLSRAPIGSAEFFAECERINALAKARADQEPKPGTLSQLFEHYKKSDHWRDNIGDRTRADYQSCMNFLQPIALTPISRITTPLVAGIHDKAAAKLGWRQANMVRTTLSQVFKSAIPRGLIDRDYTEGVPQKRRPKGAPRKNRPWTGEEYVVTLAEADPHVRVALALMANTGLDPSDALSVRRDQISGGVIRLSRAKTDVSASIPVSQTLANALENAPRHNAITLLASSRGKPWTYNGFSTVWHRLKKRLEAEGKIEPGLTLKGLRHTVATILREAGCDERTIADLLAQKTPAMARHYSDRADLTLKNQGTAQILEGEFKRRTSAVKPSLKSVKPGE